MAFWVLAIIAAMALTLLVVALAAPVRISLELDFADGSSKKTVRLHARWLMFDWGRTSGRARRTRRERVRRSDTPARATSTERKGRPRRLRAALNTRGFPGRLGRLVVELVRVLAPRTVCGWMRFGFDDPVSTGVMCGVARAAADVAQAGAWQVRLEPDFAGPALAGCAQVAWVVRPGAVLWPVGLFVASPTTWRAAWAAARAT